MTKEQRALWDDHLDKLDARYSAFLKRFPSEAEGKAVSHCMKRLTDLLRELGTMFSVEVIQAAIEFKLQSILDENATAAKAGLYEPRTWQEATAEVGAILREQHAESSLDILDSELSEDDRPKRVN